MRLERTAFRGVVLVALALGAGAGAFRAHADDEPAARACPKCCKPAKGDKCADDGTPLVAADLVGLHLALAHHSMDKEVAPGIANPFLALTKADGTIDTEKLKKLVADYETASRTTKFGDPEPRIFFPGAEESGKEPGVKDALGVGGGAETKFGGRFGGRRNLVARGGGSIATESAVEAGLKWLARHQDADGHWSASGYDSTCKGDKCDGAGIADFDVGLTGLALLAFLGAGYTPQNRAAYVDAVTGQQMRFGEVVRKGLKYLIDKQGADGSIGPQVGEMMYNHAIASIALTEAYGITNAVAYRAPAQKAINFLHTAQNYQLGWRYTPRCGQNDTSVTGWCVMALKSAQISGLEISATALEGAKAWINRVTDSNGQTGYDKLGSGEIYVPGKNEQWAHHQTMSAVGLLCRIFIDKKKGEVMSKSANIVVGDLPKWDPKAAKPTVDFYYWYYSTLALFQYDGPGGALWKKWNATMSKVLTDNQRIRKDGCKDGSWDTEGVDRWAYAGGRVYGTAINTLTLEVYYRYASVLSSEKK